MQSARNPRRRRKNVNAKLRTARVSAFPRPDRRDGDAGYESSCESGSSPTPSGEFVLRRSVDGDIGADSTDPRTFSDVKDVLRGREHP